MEKPNFVEQVPVPSLESSDIVHPKIARVKQLIANRPELFTRQATVVPTWRTIRGRRRGPYFSFRYRDGRRQRSIYLGASIPLAMAVLKLVVDTQRARRERLALKRVRAALIASLRRHLRAAKIQLEQGGLTLKGCEVRGWRNYKRNATSSLLQSSYEQPAGN